MGKFTDDEAALAREFVEVGWRLSHGLSAQHGLCSDRSCYRCRLADVLYDTEAKFQPADPKAFVEEIREVNQRLERECRAG